MSLTANALTSNVQIIQTYGSIASIFPLRVSGNRILDARNNTVILKGIGRMGLEYDGSGASRETNPAYYAQDFALMKGWGANFIRIAFNCYNYNTSNAYRSLLQTEVNACIAEGFFVLLDMHWFQNSQFPDGVWTNNNTVTNTGYDIENETVMAWVKRVVFPTLRQVAQGYNSTYYSSVIGLEINEFWPDMYRAMNWLELQQIIPAMADYIHIASSCPKYLIFWQPAFEDIFNVTSQTFRVGTSDSQNIVYAPHFYISDDYRPWFGGYLSNSTYNDGWNWTAYYDEGDYTDGKTMMYRYLDNYIVSVVTAHNVPCVFDEIGVNDVVAVGLNDMLNYFDSHGYGYNYWAWYGTSGTSNMCLLYSDWISIRNNAYWLIKHMSYKHFFQWQNWQLTMSESYNWTSGSTIESGIIYLPIATLFADGFENGFTAWNALYGNASTVTSPVLYGSYSAQENSTKNGGFGSIEKDFAGQITMYANFSFQVTQLPNNQQVQLCNFEGSPGTIATVYLEETNGNSTYRIKIQANVGGTPTSNPVTLTPNTWENLTIMLAMGTPNGQWQAWLNGAHIINVTNFSSSYYTGGTTRFSLGGGANYATTVYFDGVSLKVAITSYTAQFYALNVTANTTVTLSNGTTFNALPYWNSASKLLSFSVDPSETSIAISDPTLAP